MRKQQAAMAMPELLRADSGVQEKSAHMPEMLYEMDRMPKSEEAKAVLSKLQASMIYVAKLQPQAQQI